MKSSTHPPNINVTPLIDVLLVLLIIFMVASPLRPSRFTAKLPAEPQQNLPQFEPDQRTLVVTIEPDNTLRLNALTEMGTVDDPSKLNLKLVALFEERTRNKVYRDDMRDRFDLPDRLRVEKTVFIKAPRNM
ncbi:MAG TPA: biopolymer transporter ExbD, partial [Pyrinomonadaceae bacterium]|nr:biopolymer transporter ExbD [Pyrinomonadaceae bacterium]